MLQYIRSLIFNIVFFIWMFFVTLGCLMGAFFNGYKGINRVGETCAFMIGKFLKYIIGTTTEIRGKENIPSHNQYIIACKHQSAWETVVFHSFSKSATVVTKIELTRIPLLGSVLKKAGSIVIDRKKGKSSLSQLIEGAKKSLSLNRPVLIFPEGTRSAPGVSGRYRHGIYALYKALNVPILPIALNSGYFWPRRGFLKKKGHLVVEHLPLIEPGLGEKEFMKVLISTIEEASLKLAPDNKPLSKSPKV